MLMGSMCPESSSSRPTAARRGGKTKAAAEQKANKQPQRGLGVAQLEKIRLHNQIMAAYQSAGIHHHQQVQQDARMMQQQQQQQQVPFAVPMMAAAGSPPPFQPSSYHHHAADHRVVGVQYYGSNLQPYSSTSTLFARDSSSGRRQLGQGPHQQHYWCDESSSHGSAAPEEEEEEEEEELDLELRL